MKICVNEDLCTGHAMCLVSGPDVTVLDDLGFNKTPPDPVPAHLQEQARRAAEACPERAITIVEDD
jgi:ferredoxin